MTEKDSIKIILERRGIINNGVFDELRFRKLVTEPWIYAKTIKYGFDKMNEHNTKDVDNEPVIEEVVEIQEPITVVEEPVVAEEVVETSTESVLLDEDLKEEVEEPVVAEEVPTEEPVVDECPLYEAAPVVVEEPAVEEPAVEEPVTEEVDETPKKKTSKKK
jgi:hypothetical protein